MHIIWICWIFVSNDYFRIMNRSSSSRSIRGGSNCCRHVWILVNEIPVVDMQVKPDIWLRFDLIKCNVKPIIHCLYSTQFWLTSQRHCNAAETLLQIAITAVFDFDLLYLRSLVSILCAFYTNYVVFESLTFGIVHWFHFHFQFQFHNEMMNF